MQHPVTIAYLDCFSGISGDMFLGALLHAGLDQDLLSSELAKIPGLDCILSVEDELRQGIGCKKLTVHSPSKQQFRHLGDIIGLLKSSDLKPEIKQKAGKIFTRLADAEARVHNLTVETIHFHEVGAVDTIVDIVGTLIGLDQFGVEEISCSPLPMGRGFVRCEHGNLPLPAPAVCELLRNVPVYGVEQERELVTPTGAVLAVALAGNFQTMPKMTIKHIAYGAGSNQLSNNQPNLLRLIIGEKLKTEECQTVEVIASNLDDWNTEMFPYLCERLFASGALDVSLSPLIMKKGRPGHHLQVISDPLHALAVKRVILSETSAIGLRFHQEKRMTLARKIVQMKTQWGTIAAKQVQGPEGVVLYPEYEACKKVAKEEKVPLEQVYRAVLQGALEEE